MIGNKENLGEVETIAMPQQYNLLAPIKLSASNSDNLNWKSRLGKPLMRFKSTYNLSCMD
jgi:hypothetical protein